MQVYSPRPEQASERPTCRLCNETRHLLDGLCPACQREVDEIVVRLRKLWNGLSVNRTAA